MRQSVPRALTGSEIIRGRSGAIPQWDFMFISPEENLLSEIMGYPKAVQFIGPKIFDII